MEKFKLTRTGDVPLSFEGKVIASAGGKWHAGRDQNRYHMIAVYQTAARRYVVSIIYSTQWQGETVRHTVEVLPEGSDLAVITTTIKRYDPSADVLYGGFPPGEAYEEKQSRLIASLRERYLALVTEVLTELGAEETIE